MRGVVVSLACVTAGCAVPGDELGDRTAAITNGTRAAGDLAVVGLSRTRGQPSCTGTLIGPRVVLTAGHCISGPIPAAFFGTDPREGGIWIDGVHAVRHPQFQGGPPSINDIGLILLAELAPPSVAPVVLSAVPFDASFVGASLRIVGFGATAATAGTTGTKLEGIARLLDYDDTTFRLTGAPSQTCAGDSGGPAFVTRDGVEYVIGVASSGDVACASFGRNTRIDPYLADFVQAFVDDTALGAARVGERCFYTEHCSTVTCVSAPDDQRVRYCSAPCSSHTDCGEAMVCDADESMCRYPVPTPGAFAGACERDTDCADRVCARTSSETPASCSLRCMAENEESCPASYECGPDYGASERDACFAVVAGCGCASGNTAPGELVFSVAVLGWLGRRRRRR